VSFFESLAAYARAGHVVWMAPAWLAVTLAVKRWTPEARRRVWPSTVLLILAALLVLWGATADALGYDDQPIAAAALAFELLAVVGLAQVAAFTVVLPRIGVTVPRILVDIATGVASVVVLIVVGKRAGWSLAGLITTSAVLTAVIGFSLQDTLGNLMGGLALQARQARSRSATGSRSGPGSPAGRITEIRWRYTAIETRAWETVIIPNSGAGEEPAHGASASRAGEPRSCGRQIELFVDFRTAPTDVIAAVAGRAAAATRCPSRWRLDAGCRTCCSPASSDSYAHYTVRYWLTDLAARRLHRQRRAHPRVLRAAPGRHPAVDPGPARSSSPPRFAGPRARASTTRSWPAADDRARLGSICSRRWAAGRARDPELGGDLRPYAPFARGEVVTREGESGDGLYMLTTGTAARCGSAPASETREIARLGPGQFFGEMSLMTGAARTATVVAITDLECYRHRQGRVPDADRRAPRDRRPGRRGAGRAPRGARVGPRPARRHQPRRGPGRPGRSHPRLLRPAAVARRDRRVVRRPRARAGVVAGTATARRSGMLRGWPTTRAIASTRARTASTSA
jgi:hypothetical protein